jgi:multidrug efflux system outer membrane protein
MNKHLFLSLLGLAVAAAGCTLAPKYARPSAPVPAAWPSGPAFGEHPSATNAVAGPTPAWRQFFGDDKLQRLIGLALTNNRDLRIAVLNSEESRALYGVQRAALFPAINANGGLARTRVPGDLSTTGQPITSSEYQANLGAAAWEIDLFGRIRSLKDEALQQYFASAEARRGAQISLISSLAQAYLALAADRENQKLSETTYEAQRASYEMIKHRHDLGLVTDLDLYRAETPMDAALRDKVAYQQQVAMDQNALNLLAGTTVPGEWLPADLSGVTPPAEIAPGLPSEVLLSRPDVLQAEALLKGANADIGAARAAFFPRISLTAAIGTASSDLSGLFKAGQGAWSYAPQVALPIFDARTWSAHRAAKVQRELAVAQYEKAIQSAFRDVADALAVHGNLDQQLASQQALEHASAESYRLATSRYEKGIDNYLNVLDAQRSLFAAQQGLVSLRLAKAANQVQLYAVLGGGGQIEADPALTRANAAAGKSK